MLRVKAILPELIVGSATALALAALLVGPHSHADDAYIVARYAEHLVEHGQIVWNVGEAPVEGFTGYTLLFVMTLATWLHLPPVTFVAMLGTFAFFAGARLLYACHRPLGVSPLAGALAAAIFLCAPEQITHATSGLETEFFIFLTITCAYVAALRSHREAGSGRLWPLPVLATLCAFTRPEGIVVGGAFFLAVLFRERRALRNWLPVAVAFFVIPFGALQIFRRLYFGSFFPNTYYAKLAQAGTSSVFFSSFANHAQKYLLPAFVATLALVFLTRMASAKPTPAAATTKSARFVVLFGAIASFSVMAASYARSDLVMNYSERFAFHCFGLSSVLVLLALGELHAHFRALMAPRAIRRAVFVLTAVCLYLPFAHALEQWPKECIYRYSYALGERTHYEPALNWLKTHLPPEATIAVYPDAGIVPYSTRLRTIDFGKLNDVYLAREAHTPADVVNYFFLRKPEALMIYLARGLDKTYDEAGDRLLADPRFAEYHLELLSLDQNVGTALFVKR